MTGLGIRQYLRPAQVSAQLAFCPGCGNGIVCGLMLRAVKDLKLDWNNMLFTGGIGCAGSALATSYQVDVIHPIHGRALAFATGAKLFNQNLTTVVMSGDGDLADIGGNHLIHAARRNIDITVVLVNNMCYGMTGGQVCSTTPQGSKTMTTRSGSPYQPFNLTRLVTAAGAVYAARYSVAQPVAILNSIKKGLTTKGFCFIEILSMCPTQYGRRNEMEKATDMLKYFIKRCIDLDHAGDYSAEELEEKILTGEFTGARN